MDTKFNFPDGIEDKTVYVRLMQRRDLPVDIQSQVPKGEPIYAVHAGNGDCLAIARDRDVAFALARTNEYAPVSVH